MGQYFYIANLDKQQYLHPHDFGDGLKFMEISGSNCGTLTGLAFLLRRSDGDGGGDLHHKQRTDIVGTWAGDRIVIIGDYDSSNLFDEVMNSYANISEAVIRAMRKDEWLSEILDKRGAHY